MSDFIREALEEKLNANLRANIAAVRGAGYEVEGLENQDEPLVLRVKARGLPALPGPGAESGGADEIARKITQAKGSVRSCRFCQRQLRGDNSTGVCSAYGCRKALEKETKSSGKA